MIQLQNIAYVYAKILIKFDVPDTKAFICLEQSNIIRQINLNLPSNKSYYQTSNMYIILQIRSHKIDWDDSAITASSCMYAFWWTKIVYMFQIENWNQNVKVSEATENWICSKFRLSVSQFKFMFQMDIGRDPKKNF